MYWSKFKIVWRRKNIYKRCIPKSNQIKNEQKVRLSLTSLKLDRNWNWQSYRKYECYITSFKIELLQPPNVRCDSVGPVGCIYRDLISEPQEFRIQMHSKLAADVTQCLRGCRAIFPDAFFAGARLNDNDELECFCLEANAFNATTLGPSANCNQVMYLYSIFWPFFVELSPWAKVSLVPWELSTHRKIALWKISFIFWLVQNKTETFEIFSHWIFCFKCYFFENVHISFCTSKQNYAVIAYFTKVLSKITQKS